MAPRTEWHLERRITKWEPLDARDGKVLKDVMRHVGLDMWLKNCKTQRFFTSQKKNKKDLSQEDMRRMTLVRIVKAANTLRLWHCRGRFSRHPDETFKVMTSCE